MKRSIFSSVFSVLMAGLLVGSAERVFAAAPTEVPIGISQSEAVLYALTLVDATTKGPATDATTAYQVCLTVSVPRTGYEAPAIGVNANPATVMYRPHLGRDASGETSTAWSGSIFMTAETPSYYPMPQTGTIDRAPVARGAEIPDTLTNLAIGTVRDPARWERRFYSNTLTSSNPLVASLIAGEATYEWYVASRYGLGFFTVVSDIQDHGRKMDFTDYRLWEGQRVDNDSDNAWDSNGRFGTNNYHTLQSMHRATDSGWQLNKVALGTMGDAVADEGALLLQDPTVSYANLSAMATPETLNKAIGDSGAESAVCPSIVSPTYPNGISQVTFKAKAGLEVEGNEQYLLVQVARDDGAWTTEGVTIQVDGGQPFTQAIADPNCLIQLKTTLSTISVKMDESTAGAANMGAKFRIVRISSYENVVSEPVSLMVCVRELRVRSATPVATFEAPYVTNADGTTITPASEDEAFMVHFAVRADASRKPCGYAAELRLARRADGDSTRLEPKVTLQEKVESGALSTLYATFEPIGEKYACDSLGNNNLTEDAFYVRQSQVTGLMAGIYDMTLDCDVLGSFEAGRTLIDARERVTHEISVLDPPVDEPERVMRPFILDVREAQTQAEKVELVVQYRTQVMDGTIDYELRETVIEMVPQGLNDKTWTVELPRELTVSREGKFLPSGATTPKDEDAEYVWCEDPTATNGPANAMTEVLNFRLRVTTANNAPNGEPIVRWFGQPEHLTEGQSPTMVNVFPGSTFATSSGIKSDDTTTLFPAPVLVNLAELATSHVTLTFVEGEGVEAEGSLSINGSFAQDFNTWDAISNDLFGDSEFRENVRWAVADFDAEVVPSGDTYRILSGWLPDQGPLADTTELFDAFIAARGYSDMPNVGDYPFYIEPLDTQGSEHHFASWGASHAPASPTLLREDEKRTNLTTENFRFNGIDKVEMVINREVDDMHSTPAAGWMPDLMMRLSEASELSPREGLKGIGTLSFNLSRSEPYNISKIYIFKKTTQATYTGLSSTVTINAHTKAGYSTSLYLTDVYGTTKYEMRVTQVLNMSKSMNEEDKPKDCLVVELWKWDGSTATNLKFNTGRTYLQLNSPATLDGQTLSMWVDENSRLRAQVGTTTVLVSDLSVPTTYAHVAVGSAECWPTFSTLAYATEASNNRPSFANYFTGGSDLAPGNLSLPAGMWTLPGAATSILSIQRNPMNADNVAKLSITGTMSDGKQLDPIEIVCKDAYAETPVSLTLGRTDLKLILTAASGSHVFIDNVRVSSWQGNDDTRTGNDFVPEFTDESWEEGRTNDGFSAVGVWILPEEESQNTVAKENYKGEQCLLMQYSRRNLSSGLNVYEDQSLGVTHTGSTLALYTPFSNEGFGTVSFRYRIPTQSEFNAGAQNPDVRLLLQYARRSGPAIDNLKSPVSNAQWENVSEIIELPCTAGEWKTASITPRLDGNPILADNEGVLRLVMVKPDLQEHDPYIYIDDFRITSNAGEKALWAAGNSLLAESPIHSLYWKDRLEATQTEADFAWYSRLTRGMLFNNDVAADTENGEELPAAYIASPISKNGIGLVKFAARLNTANRLPTTVTLYVTTEETNPTFPDDYEAVETFDVTDTVYRQFSVDLAKHTKVVDAKALRGVCLYVPTMNDTITNHKLKTSRVWMDKLVVSEPVSPTLRLRNVTFSTVPGDDFSMHQLVPEGATDLYDPQDGRNSPLSQPIANAPLVVKVTVDRMQQVKPETVRVFFTYDKTGTDANIKALTSSYSYTDVLGNRFSANATTPIYTWNNALETSLTENSAEADLKAALDHLAAWSLDVWFATPKASVATLLSEPDAATRKGNFAKLEGLDASIEATFKNAQFGTIALTGQETYDSTDTLLTFVSTEDVGCVKDLAPNSMVRYAVWAIFETEDSTAENPRYGYTVLDASSYTDHPWYFPRNFNAEMRDRYNVVVDYLADYLNYPKASSNFFSPYFWVYDTVPGEVFINEFNMWDGENNNDPELHAFVELCSPVAISLSGWRLDFTTESNLSNNAMVRLSDENAKDLSSPQAGAVPVQRVAGTQANRSFFTLIDGLSLQQYEGDTTNTVTTKTAQNAGRAASFSATVSAVSLEADSMRLYRPTGGIEHIVVYSRYKAESSENKSRAVSYMNDVTADYRTYYKTEKFGSEWFQAFREGGWETHPFDAETYVDVDNSGSPVKVTEAHRARRLSVASYYNGTDNGNYDRENAATDPSFISDEYAKASDSKTKKNSIATVDMGGVWVMRTNDNSTEEGISGQNGPTDVSDLFATNWPGHNPTEKSRSGSTAAVPPVQITPRQINLDQYMLYYADPNGNSLTSRIEGLGQHTAEFYNGETPPALVNTIHGGRRQMHRSIVSASSVTLTYAPLAFNKLESLTLTIINTKDGVIIDENDTITVNGDTMNILSTLLDAMNGEYTLTTTADGTIIEFTIDDAAAVDAYEVSFLTSIGTNLYSFEFNATFVADVTLSNDIIQEVRPFCGDTLQGSAKYQPWKGSSFGFSALYDAKTLTKMGVRLVGAVVTYPTPGNMEMNPSASWTGLGAVDLDNDNTADIEALTGMEEADAWVALNTLADKDLLRTASLGTTRKLSEDQSEIYNAAAVPVLADAYDTDTIIEPAIPYIVWGVYSVTIQVGAETETVRYFMPQEVSAGRSPMPKWYQPLARLGTVLPYFYLYSTPPESAWLNEVNLTAGTNPTDVPFAEVVFPVLRDGITNADVPQPSIAGWSVKSSAGETKTFTTETGVRAGVSTSYNFYSINLDETDETMVGETVGYALIRPCGAGEGGVWTGFDATGGTPVTAGTENMGMWMREGETDATDGQGSVQLVGEAILREGNYFISSTADQRTRWEYCDYSNRDKNNTGVNVDDNPEWNRVRVTSTLVNTVYGGSPCGYHDFDNLPESTLPIGFGENDSLAGGEWVSTVEVRSLGRYISYRPRAGYTYDYLQLPPEWMGRVILVGQRIAKKTDPFPESEICDRAQQAVALANTFKDPMDQAAALVSLNGFATAERSGGVFTGKILFNGEKEFTEDLLFKDVDDYVITVLLIEEPIAATNELTMGLRPGTVEAGAWLVSQTLYGLKKDANVWVPDEDKGGSVAANPIWDDESGNGEGEHLHRHGWLYQPVIGDTLSMSAVIRPDNGLYSDDFDIVAEMTSDKPTIRPMLVWTVIDKTKAANIFTSSDAADIFLTGWDISYMLGGTPSLRDGISTSFTTVRQNIEATNNEGINASTLYVAGGILPMSFRGIRKDDDGDASTNDFEPKASLTDAEVMALNESDAPYLVYSVMTDDELASAIKENGSLQTIAGLPTNAADDGMVDLTSVISMDPTKGIYWQEGSILRFAVVLVDVTTGRILDTQGISNFKSDELPIYCPWYVPEETANINYLSSSKKAGYAPYAWIYDIGANDVWINEIRPFMSDDPERPSQGTAVELAMTAAPYDEDSSTGQTTYTPKQSLDGWKLVVKYAPMPAMNEITEDTKMEWVRSTDTAAQRNDHPLYGRTVNLKSWIPARRILVDSTTGQEDYWDLDYYCIATSAEAIASMSLKLNKVEDYATNPTGFAYLKTASETLLEITNPETDNPYNDILVEMTDPDTGEKTYELRRNIFPDYAALMESGKIPNATNGVVFGIELVRNNGVVTDELLFMYTTPSTLSTTLQENLNAVVAIEERNFASANTIRAVYASIATKGDMSFMFVDEVVDTNNDGETDKVENTFWVPGVVSNGVSHTFPGANIFSFDATYKQPRLSYTYSLPSYLRLSANVTGDDENGLGITTMKSTIPKAKVRFTRIATNGEELYIDDGSFKRSVTHSQMTKGTNYTLRLTPVIKEWFDCSIKCNNSSITPVKEETITFTDETTNELWTLPCYTIVADKPLIKDSDYEIVLNLTQKAKDLKDHDQFSKAENVNYEAWLLKSGTIAQLTATLEADDVSFAEKFWLGFGSALESGEDVDLNFSYIGTILGPDGVTTSPSLAVRLQNGTTPINELKSDGVLVLCGKVNLSDDAWTYITTINPKDVNLDAEKHFKYLQPATDCKIFKVILVSETDARALKNATP